MAPPQMDGVQHRDTLFYMAFMAIKRTSKVTHLSSQTCTSSVSHTDLELLIQNGNTDVTSFLQENHFM